MAASDLTSLAAVKAWLNITTTTSDATLSALVSSVSRGVYSALARPGILPATFTEVFDGSGGRAIQLRNYPVIGVATVTMGGMTVPQAPALPAFTATYPGIGWVLETVDPTPPSRLAQIYLRGDRFWRGEQNVSVTYTAGYQVSSEADAVPSAPYQITAAQPFGAWASDMGVTYANGQALAKVALAPLAGQYSVSGGVYTFAAADVGAAVLISYGFIPGDLAQAALEWAAFRFKARDNIGYRSKSLGGQETVTLDTSRAPDIVMAMMQPYKRVSLGR